MIGHTVQAEPPAQPMDPENTEVRWQDQPTAAQMDTLAHVLRRASAFSMVDAHPGTPRECPGWSCAGEPGIRRYGPVKILTPAYGDGHDGVNLGGSGPGPSAIHPCSGVHTHGHGSQVSS